MTEISSATDLAIKAEGLVRRFGDNEAVAGVDLQVAPGEIYGFLGPNGAGKSTTVRMLCTLIAPSDGRAEVAGYDVATQPGQVRLRIGVALQDAALDPKQTGRELLDLQGRCTAWRRASPDAPGAAGGAGRHRRRPRPADRHLLGRDEAPARPRRRAHPQPSVLFLDEPTTGLDPLSPARGVGGGPPPQRPGHHHLPHHPVPGGGRRAGRPGGHHRRRPARRRRHHRTS